MSWPELKYQDWKQTYETLHRWIQIAGKVKLTKEPWVNHSWHSVFYVTSSGLSSLGIPLGDQNFSIEFDFILHQVVLQLSDGRRSAHPLQSESVADFYRRFLDSLQELGLECEFVTHPCELEDAEPFADDTQHCTYHPEQAHAWWQALVAVNNVFKVYRSGFIGKSSPVQFYWGSFDLSVTRFSGRRAPEHPGGIPHLPDVVVKEAYSHEEITCGFWPGNEIYPQAAFFSYAYPAPEGYERAKVQPATAFFHPQLKEFILPYEDVRQSASPATTLMGFILSTYEAGATLGRWNRHELEESPFPWAGGHPSAVHGPEPEVRSW
jgi:hypothetical protein